MAVQTITNLTQDPRQIVTFNPTDEIEVKLEVYFHGENDNGTWYFDIEYKQIIGSESKEFQRKGVRLVTDKDLLFGFNLEIGLFYYSYYGKDPDTIIELEPSDAGALTSIIGFYDSKDDNDIETVDNLFNQ